MSSLFDNINLENLDYNYTLIQTMRSKTPINILNSAFDRTIDPSLDGVGKLKFTISRYTEDILTHEKIENPEYNSIMEENLILLKVGEPSNPMFQAYYIIKNLNESTDTSQMIVDCVSFEQVLEGNIITLNGIERELINNTDNNGIMNLVEQQCSWKVGYVDPNCLVDLVNSGVNPRVRWIEALSKSILSFLHDDICPAYNVIMMFDTYNKLINIYDKTAYGTHTGILLTEENYIKNLTKNIKGDSVCTRLLVSGKESMEISSLTLDGLNYVTNYDYYINNGQMSPELIQALSYFNALLVKKDAEFKILKSQLDAINQSMVIKKSELDTLVEVQKSLDQIQANCISANPPDNVNLAIATPKCNANLLATTVKKAEMATLDAQIDVLEIPMKQIGLDIAKANARVIGTSTLIFNTALLEELESWTIDEEWSSDVYVTPALLKKAAEDLLAVWNTPVTEYGAEMVDIFSIQEAQHIRGKIKLGDLVRVYSPKIKANVDQRMISYSHNIDAKTLSIIFSNTDKKLDDAVGIGTSIKKTINASKYVNVKRLTWDKTEGLKDRVDTYLSNVLNCSAQAIVSLQGKNKTSITENGIFVVEVGNEDCGVCILAGRIYLTKDGFLTVSTAIDSTGVYAPELVGIMMVSQKMYVVNSAGNFSITENGFEMKDEQYKTLISPKGIVCRDNTNFSGNCDPDNPLEIDFFIDENVNVISQVLLKLTVQDFRADSKSAAGGGATTVTSESGGSSETTSEGGGGVTATSEGGGGATVTSLGGGSSSTSITTPPASDYDSSNAVVMVTGDTTSTDGTAHHHFLPNQLLAMAYNHTHRFIISIGSHVHKLVLDSHVHKLILESHVHLTKIPSHKHGINILDHVHALVYGIFRKPLTLGVMDVYVNGVKRYTSINQQEIIDLSQYITTKGWNNIQVTSPGLNRLSAAISIKTYIGA